MTEDRAYFLGLLDQRVSSDLQSSYIVRTMKLWVGIARQRNWSAESGADSRCWMMTSAAGRLRRANEILTTASAFLRHGSARHGVDGRVRRRVQGPFQGRDRPRPGDGRHAGTGSQGRAGTGNPACTAAGRPSPPDRRGARAAGPASRNAGSRRGLEASAPVLGLQDTGTDRTGYYSNQAAQAAPL